MLIDERPVHFHSPRDAIQAGVGMVHQHFMLVPSQTVAENVFLGLRQLVSCLHRERMAADVQKISEQYGLPVDPRAKIWQLSVGEQQRVEIIKILYRGARRSHPGRTDGRAHAAGKRNPVSDAAHHDGGRQDDHLHLAQVGGSAGGGQPHHRAAQWPARSDHRSQRHDQGRTCQLDGWPPGALSTRQAANSSRATCACRWKRWKRRTTSFCPPCARSR